MYIRAVDRQTFEVIQFLSENPCDLLVKDEVPRCIAHQVADRSEVATPILSQRGKNSKKDEKALDIKSPL